MDVATVRRETAKALGCKEDDLDYITEDYVAQMGKSAREADLGSGDPDGNKSAVPMDRWGQYGNSLSYSADKVYWWSNDKGTSNYGCGSSIQWWALKSFAVYIKDIGACAGGKRQCLLSNYQ